MEWNNPPGTSNTNKVVCERAWGVYICGVWAHGFSAGLRAKTNPAQTGAEWNGIA